VTTDPRDPADRPSISALLPRDWPRQVDRLIDDLGASTAFRAEVLDAAFALVDSWVLAAVDATAATDHRTPRDP
jgi:hypothetical protein